MLTVNTISALLSMNPATSNEVYVAGYYSPGDLGGGEFYYDAGSSATPNNGTIFQSSYTGSGRWYRVLNGTRVNARWFGAAGDGSTDDTAALQTAFNYCGASGFGLYISNGIYIVSSGSPTVTCLTISYSGFYVEGDGYESEIRNANSSPSAGLVLLQAVSGPILNVTVQNLHLNGNKSNQSGTWTSHCITVTSLSTSSTTPQNITLDGLYCQGAYSYDPVNTEGGGIRLLGDDFGYTMTQYPSQNIIINGCFCWDNDGWGIGTNWNNGVIITNNCCWNNGTQGIAIWNSQDCVINNNKCYDNASIGINTEISDRIVISGNNVRCSALACIRLFNTIDSVVTSNDCELNVAYYFFSTINLASGDGTYNGGANYKTRPCSNIQITGNNFRSVGSEGFVFSSVADLGYGSNDTINVSDNFMMNVGASGKGISANCNNLALANNKIYGYVYVDMPSGFLTLDSNDIELNNFPSSFELTAFASSPNLVIKGNTFRCNTNGNAAVSITQYTPNAVVFDNVYQGAFSNFIVLSGSAVSPIQRDNLAW